MKITFGFIIPVFCFMVSLHAQDTLNRHEYQQINDEQEIERKLQEIQLRKEEHSKKKEALEKQLHVHNKRTYLCNNTRIKKIEKHLEGIDSDALACSKKQIVSELEIELMRIKNDNVELFLNNPEILKKK